MDGRAAIWLDGQLIDAAAATVGLGAHSLHYGTAVFDGGRFYRGDDGHPAIFRLEDHVRRLFASARALFMELAHSPAEVMAASVAVVRASGLGEGYVRQLAYYGDDALGIGADNRPHLAVLTWRPRAAPGATVRVRVAGFGHGDGWIPTAKHAGFYGRSFLALREARASGCDDALFCAADGTLAEATGATLFAVIDGVMHTPPLSAPILPGVTRATLLELARLDGIPTREGPLPRHRALAADELFLANSAAELRPIAALDGRPFAAPGPITARLQRRYADAVRGRIPELRGWLTMAGET
jgi:branched-chain amino acid aminotransferase